MANKVYTIENDSWRDIENNIQILSKSGKKSSVYIKDISENIEFYKKNGYEYRYPKNGVEAIIKFIKLKKWGYDKPNFKAVDCKTLAVSKWAMGMVIGRGGNIIKAIQRYFGFVKVIPLPFKDDSHYQYGYLTRIHTIAPLKIKESLYEDWFRIATKSNAGGGTSKYYIPQSIKDNTLYTESQYDITDKCYKKASIYREPFLYDIKKLLEEKDELEELMAVEYYGSTMVIHKNDLHYYCGNKVVAVRQKLQEDLWKRKEYLKKLKIDIENNKITKGYFENWSKIWKEDIQIIEQLLKQR